MYDDHVCMYRDLGLELFGSMIVSQTRIQTRVVKGVLALIHRERYELLCISGL